VHWKAKTSSLKRRCCEKLLSGILVKKKANNFALSLLSHSFKKKGAADFCKKIVIFFN
jgi:hypothetical protein